MVICLERSADLHIAQLMPLSLASVKSRLVLPFWYWLTNGPLSGTTRVSRYQKGKTKQKHRLQDVYATVLGHIL